MITIPGDLLDLYMSDPVVRDALDRGRFDGIPLETCLIACVQTLVVERDKVVEELANIYANCPISIPRREP